MQPIQYDVVYKLLAELPPVKILAITNDLHFDIWDPTKLSPGQLRVLSKRLRRASFKTLKESDDAAEESELIISMRQSLANFLWRLHNEPDRSEDSE